MVLVVSSRIFWNHAASDPVQPTQHSLPQTPRRPPQTQLSVGHPHTPSRQSVGRRLVFDAKQTVHSEFNVQSSLQTIDLSVSKLLVCVAQLKTVPGSILAFKHLHASCYAEYSVTVTVIQQIKTWDNMVIFRYIASKRNLKAAVERAETTAVPAEGVPFRSFYQAVKADYKKFDFHYYRSHYENEAKQVVHFFEKNSLI